MDVILASKLIVLAIPLIIIMVGICWFIYELK